VRTKKVTLRGKNISYLYPKKQSHHFWYDWWSPKLL